MLQCKNGRLYFDVEPQTLSFAIPDGFWIETDPSKNSRNVIELRVKDRNIEVEVDVWDREEGNAEEDLKKRFNEAPPECLTEIRPICIKNGTRVEDEVEEEAKTNTERNIYGCSLMCFDGGCTEYAAVIDIAPFGFMQNGMHIQQVNVTALIKENYRKKMEITEAEAVVGKLLANNGVMDLVHSVHVG